MKENYRTSSDSGDFGAFSNPDYYTLLKDVVKNWWVIAMTGVIAALIFRILPMIGYSPTYTASTTVLVTGTIRNDDSFSTYSGTAQQFANLLTDDYLLQEIAEDMQVRKLNVKVNADIISDTNVVSLTVQAAKPTTAYRVLKGILEHYPDISELMYPGYVLEQLIPPEYPSSPDPNPMIGGNARRYVLAAMAAMTALILLLSMFYDNVCNEKDAINKLDAGLLTTVYHEKKRFSMGFGKKKRKHAILYTYPAVSFGFVQSYKKLREKITSRCDVSGKKVILITSMLENEGKSTVAANLPLSLAEKGKKVLLIDGDMQNPSVCRALQVNPSHRGLSDFLTGRAKVNEVIRFPPAMVLGDSLALSRAVDGCIYVVRSDYARSSVILDGFSQMADYGCRIIGTVLNAYASDGIGYGYGYGGSKYKVSKYSGYYESSYSSKKK